MAADLGPNAVPDRIAIDAHGYGWRVWDDQEMWSMVPQNPDNEPIPEPLTWFVREDEFVPADEEDSGSVAGGSGPLKLGAYPVDRDGERLYRRMRRG